MIQISGTVTRLTFHNKENGYTIARFDKEDGEKITLVGALPGIREGQTIEVVGEFTNHPKYGPQFKIEKWQEKIPKSLDGILAYLSSGAIKGIGPSLANRIVDHFQEDTLTTIDHYPNRLLEIEGIGKSKLKAILDSWQGQKSFREIALFFQEHGISSSLINKLYTLYGNDCVKLVQEDPFRLAYEVRGIGFKKADAIAKSMGFSEHHPARISAALMYALSEATGEGDLYLLKEDLIANTKIYLSTNESDENIVDQLIIESLTHLTKENRIQIEEGGTPAIPLHHEKLVAKEERIYLKYLWHFEERCGARLNEISKSTHFPFKGDVTKLIEMTQSQLSITLSELQREAILAALQEKLLIITGGPGTGKTTLLKGVVALAKLCSLTFLLAAPTGRAAKRLNESTKEEAKTLHRVLEYNPSDHSFGRHGSLPLEADLIIVDESSMIDTELFHHLLNAVPKGATLILVGDINQLPSVGPGNVLKEVIASSIGKVITLDTVFRQASQSAIIRNAWSILRGEVPETENKPSDDFLFLECESSAEILETVKKLFSHRIKKSTPFDPSKDVQVLVPMYKGEIGADELNKAITQILIPNKELSITKGTVHFHIGERVMQIRNNYDKGVYNGDTGIIEHIDLKHKQVVVNFEGTKLIYDASELEELTHAWAITIHKSQGSEYLVVILILSSSHYNMLQRDLLYTAVTRGKKLVLVVGQKKALNIAVHSHRSSTRNSALLEKIQKYKTT